jgi:mannose-1-phosphate guanylyltransferase
VVGILTVTHRDLLERAAEELAGGGPALRYIAEPFGRNTAPAVAVAALEASLVWGENALLFVMPSVDWIQNVAAFVGDAQAAAVLAARGRLVALGVVPTRMEPGFGWLELGEPIEGTAGFEVTGYVEDPPPEAEQRLAADGRHLRDTGLFCFTAGAILESFEKYHPAMLELAQESWIAADRRELRGGLVAQLDEDAFAQVPERSLVDAVIDDPGNVAAIRARFDWTGMGAASAVGTEPPREGDSR